MSRTRIVAYICRWNAETNNAHQRWMHHYFPTPIESQRRRLPTTSAWRCTHSYFQSNRPLENTSNISCMRNFSTYSSNANNGITVSVDESADSSNSNESLLDHYESLIRSGEVTRDPHQIEALKELDRLRIECLPYSTELNNKEKEDGSSSSIERSEDESWSMTSLFSLTPSWANPSTGDDVPKQNQSSKSPPRGIYLHGGVG